MKAYKKMEIYYNILDFAMRWRPRAPAALPPGEKAHVFHRVVG
jgi:hypothetical protein